MINKEISDLLTERAAAVKAKDIARATAFYEENLRVYDLVEPMERRGKAGVADRLEQWLGSFQTIEDYSFSRLEIHGSADLSICSFFNHVKAIKSDATILDMFWRETLGLKNINGTWLIIHSHSSVPFDPATGKASMALKPDF